MPTRYDSAGRIQPIETRNLARPGECLLCKRIGHNPDEIFADIKVELDFYGDCYLCQDCCHEIASFVMAFPYEQWLGLKSEMLALKSHNEALQKKITYLRSLLNARIDASGSSEPSSDGSVSVPLFEVEPDSTFIDRILDPNKSVSA